MIFQHCFSDASELSFEPPCTFRQHFTNRNLHLLLFKRCFFFLKQDVNDEELFIVTSMCRHIN